MKKSFLSLCLAVTSISLTSCDNAEYKPYNNSIYIAESYGGNQKSIVVNENGATIEFIVRTAEPTANALTVSVAASEDALTKYNVKTGTKYKMLPKDYFTFSTNNVQISEGGLLSGMVRITIAPQAHSLLAGEDKFVLPVTIISVSDASLHVMDNLKTCVFICTKSE